MGGGLRRYSRQAEDVMTFVAELKRRNERLCSLSLIGSIDGGEGLKRLHSLSPIGFIDGGEGWGEGAGRQIAATRTKIERIPQIERIPLTQPSPPSTLGGEGLKHCVAAIATAAAGMRRTP
jgi:hypothetical protein